MSTLDIPVYPGIDLDDSFGPALNSVGVAFICCSFVTIAVRLVSLKVTKIDFGHDEHFIVIAAVLSWIYTAIVVNQVLHNFFGQRVGKSDLVHLEARLKEAFAMAILYPMALTASKLSLLALYYRTQQAHSKDSSMDTLCTQRSVDYYGDKLWA
ncbi:hypothetical protein LTR66_002296 [Elasticomyces elasticus]|nr:hypothetical protein LTR28_003823 [Elasticomyces elasticus]KAK4998478.1 hypothetical protein LTR66_002296 [Elasticomyces elasticus]